MKTSYHCCNHDCRQGRNCPLTMRYPRTSGSEMATPLPYQFCGHVGVTTHEAYATGQDAEKFDWVINARAVIAKATGEKL